MQDLSKSLEETTKLSLKPTSNPVIRLIIQETFIKEETSVRRTNIAVAGTVVSEEINSL
jgi:hypothetical protein